MKNELDNYQFFEKKRGTALQSFNSFMTAAVTGLADWIGLGSTVKHWIENDKKWGGVKTETVNNIKTELTKRINELVQKDQLDLDQLQQKLDNLASMGFSLTGVARKRYNETASKLKNDIKGARERLSKTNNFAVMAQADVDSLKSLQDTTDYTELEQTKDKIAHIEKQIGDYNNG